MVVLTELAPEVLGELTSGGMEVEPGAIVVVVSDSGTVVAPDSGTVEVELVVVVGHAKPPEPS